MVKKVPCGRGKNPNSHGNRKMGVQGKEISLTPEQWGLLEKIGNGNKSEGIRILIRIHQRSYPGIPAPRQVLDALFRAQLKIEDAELRQEIEDAIASIKSWGIEADYEDAIAEEVITLEGGAYIV